MSDPNPTIRISTRRQEKAWRCLRCKAGAEWIYGRRCHRCGAGSEWLDRVEVNRG